MPAGIRDDTCSLLPSSPDPGRPLGPKDLDIRAVPSPGRCTADGPRSAPATFGAIGCPDTGPAARYVPRLQVPATGAT